MPVSSEHLRDSLLKYVPEEVVDDCIEWIRAHRIMVRIKKSRQSKYGDYHPPLPGQNHKITINHDLNKYAFLITFTHEVAHLLSFNKYGNRHAPHGAEWKREFKNLLIPLLYKNIFPDDIKHALIHYLRDPAASSCTDTHLLKALNRYNVRKEGWLHLEDLAEGTFFKTVNGKHFKKGPKLRKNYECFDEFDHKYFIHPLMEVREILNFKF
jgi:SprT protein